MRSLVAAASLLPLAVAVLLAPVASAQADAEAAPRPCSGDFDVYCYDDSGTVCPPYPECHTYYHMCLVYYTVSARHFCLEGGVLPAN